jgi:hypothetical protein
MTTRSQINSNFYQIVNVDANSNPTQVKPEYITEVGTLANLSVTGNANIGNISTGIITATGNITAPNFIGNVIGNISGNFVVPGANMDVIFNNNGNAGASNQFQFDTDNNTLTVGGPLYAQSFFGDGAGLYNITAANVSGLGNIVTVNLDGNSGNILYGNGVFSAVPNVANVANANFANYAGNLVVSGNENNVYVKTSNTVIESRTQVGNAYTEQYQTQSTWEVFPEDDNTGANPSWSWIKLDNSNIDSPNLLIEMKPANTGIEQRWTFDALGNLTLPGNTFQINYANGTQVPLDGPVANANYANFAGTAYSVSGSNVSGEVANANFATYSNQANTANLATYATTANSVAGANVTGTVANANYSAYANIAATANSVAVANVVGIGNIATINLTGSTSNVLFGNGVFAAIPTDDANFANFAGNVTVSAQPNITSTGNLVSLTINNGVAGSTTKQFQPNGISIGSTANINLMANSSFVDIDYGNGQGGGNVLLGKSQTFLKARGNASSITTANVSDKVGRTNFMFYNGTGNVLAAATQVTPFSNFNSNANAVTMAGQYQIITGNPNGDQGNANALSNQNVFSVDPFGRITVQQGAAGTTSVAMNINTFGGSGGNAAAASQNILWYRSRGNRDAQLSVQPNDQVGGLLFTTYNGTAQFATRSAAITSLVDSAYVANNANVPTYLRFQTCDNTTTYTHNFYSNGNVQFNSSKTVTAGFFIGDGSNLTNVTGNISNSATGCQITLNPSVAGSPFLYINGNSTSANTGSLQLTDSGLTVTLDGDVYPGGAPSFAFSTYQDASSSIPPQFYKRYHGTPVSPTGVANGDQILNQYYQVYGDSGNTNITLGGVIAGVGNIASPGNISFEYNVYSTGNANDKFNVTFPNINLNGNVTANNASINSGGFMKLSSYTASGLTAITGQIGWMAAVSNSGGGGNPNGMIAFWDTTNNRWSYIHDNSAV